MAIGRAGRRGERMKNLFDIGVIVAVIVAVIGMALGLTGVLMCILYTIIEFFVG